ncbi:MAG: NAD-dependent epimerase/dehydratase family protein [Pirellulaceae bacterium]|nr:NAD-dependent epimerase/dehydratase family protein [Pirellulaceae bacterium]
MKYLVTGATGLLGNNVVRQLLDAGHEVRVLARDPAAKPLAGLAVESVAGDIRDAGPVRNACEGVEVVVHAAGHVHIGWKGLDLARRINVEGTRNIASASRAAGARLVHVSSVNALGLGALANPASEDDALPQPLSIPYVLTKREAEQVVQEEVARGSWGVIVNPGTMFGPWDWKPSSGQMLLEVTKFALFAPLGAGCFCDVRDVAAGAIAAAARGQPGRRYILGGQNLSFRDCWTRIAALAGKPGPRLPMGAIFRAIASPIADLMNCFSQTEGSANSAALAMSRQEHCFSSARAERELGYACRPIEESLADAWAWFGEQGYRRK